MHPNIGTTYLRIIPEDLQRYFAVKTTVRPFSIIEYPVLFYHLLRLRWIFKEISIEAFISKLVVKAFKITILPGAAFFSEFVAYTVFLNKLLEGQASKLRPLVCSYDSCNAIEPDTFLKDFYNQLSRNTETSVNAQRKPAEDVLNSHDLNAPAICKGIKEEIYSPDMIAKQRLCQRHLHDNPFFILAWSVSLQTEAFIDTIDPFMVGMDALPVYSKMDTPVALKGVFKGYLLYHLSKSLVSFCFSGLIIQTRDPLLMDVCKSEGCVLVTLYTDF